MKAHYIVNKKLSQFDSFQYIWNFDISRWMFGKHFVNGGLHPKYIIHKIGTNMNKLISN